MKYAAEDMLRYIKDNGMEEDFFKATEHNNLGFYHVHVPGKIIFQDGQPLFYHQTSDDRWDTVALDLKLFSKKDFEAVILDPAHIYVEVISIHEKCHITMACYKKESKQEDAKTSVLDDVAIQFIRYAGIDTPGKAKKVIRDSYNILQTLQDTSKFFKIS